MLWFIFLEEIEGKARLLPSEYTPLRFNLS